jgi:GDP-L-fucose synthase
LIGRSLLPRLLGLGARVRTASLDEFADAPAGVEHTRADLREASAATAVMAGVDGVFHLAGVRGSVGIQNTMAATIFTTNLLVNTQVFEAARLAGVARILYASTISIYPPMSLYREDLAWSANPHPADQFGAWSKRMGEKLLEAYEQQYGLTNAAIVRPVNTFGPFDNFDPRTALVIPALIKRVLDGEDPLRVWGSGRAVRDFLFVADLVDGMLLAFERGLGLGPFNLGSGRGYSIAEVVDAVLRATGRRPRVEWDASQPAGEDVKVADVTRARALLGFEPSVGLEEGIARTVAWYESNRERAQAHFSPAELAR